VITFDRNAQPASKKMSKHTLVGGNGHELLALLGRYKTRAEQRLATPIKVVTIHEVGLDGFWVHRLLDANGIESHVVDPASITVPRRHRAPRRMRLTARRSCVR
jgi:transposase